jgi:hypothetical protein
VVEEARYEFEEDVWSTDDEPAEESGPAQACEVEPAACPEPASPEHTPKAPPRKRGPKPDHETALPVAGIVARVAPDGDWRSRVDDSCDAPDDEQVPVPATWRRNRNVRKWSLCDDRDIVVKAIDIPAWNSKTAQETRPRNSLLISANFLTATVAIGSPPFHPLPRGNLQNNSRFR